MRRRSKTAPQLWLVGGIALSAVCAASPALARHHANAHGGFRHGRKFAHAGLQCVPFARNDSGIELTGNANTWWNQAEGIYQRGARPEPGAVLSFASNGRMRLGHVAVVSDLVGARVITIDHANWWGPGARGGVSRGVTVVDVSERNDWSAVRVALGRDGDFGSVYPTNGFIYDRPDTGTMVAAGPPAMQVALGPAPADLRGRAARSHGDTDAGMGVNTDPTLGPVPYDEVAEAPDDTDAPRQAVRHRHGIVRHRHRT